MDPATVSNLIQGGGTVAVIGLLFYMWRDATGRADRLQLERDALLERVLTVFNSTAQAIKDQNRLFETLLSGKRE
jgi:hypothetical protein